MTRAAFTGQRPLLPGALQFLSCACRPTPPVNMFDQRALEERCHAALVGCGWQTLAVLGPLDGIEAGV